MNRSIAVLALLCLTAAAPSFAGMGEDLADAPLAVQTGPIQDLARTLAESRADYTRRLYDVCVYYRVDKTVAEKAVEEIAADVLSGKLDPRQADSNGETALHALARRWDTAASPSASATPRQAKLCEQMGPALLSLHAEPNRRDNQGWTPLQIAALNPEHPYGASWRASALYTAMVAAGGDENLRAPNGLSAKQLLAQEIEKREHPRTLSDRELCEMDQMSCR